MKTVRVTFEFVRTHRIGFNWTCKAGYTRGRGEFGLMFINPDEFYNSWYKQVHPYPCPEEPVFVDVDYCTVRAIDYYNVTCKLKEIL